MIDYSPALEIKLRIESVAGEFALCGTSFKFDFLHFTEGLPVYRVYVDPIGSKPSGIPLPFKVFKSIGPRYQEATIPSVGPKLLVWTWVGVMEGIHFVACDGSTGVSFAPELVCEPRPLSKEHVAQILGH